MNMKLGILRRFRKRPQHHNRSFVRYDCQVDTSITLIDRMVSLDGRLLDLSQGGALFRPKLAYIMRRNGEPICLRIGEEDLFGHIVSTSPKGFSLRFDEPIEEGLFNRIVAEMNIDPAKAAA